MSHRRRLGCDYILSLSVKSFCVFTNETKRVPATVLGLGCLNASDARTGFRCLLRDRDVDLDEHDGRASARSCGRRNDQRFLGDRRSRCSRFRFRSDRRRRGNRSGRRLRDDHRFGGASSKHFSQCPQCQGDQRQCGGDQQSGEKNSAQHLEEIPPIHSAGHHRRRCHDGSDWRGRSDDRRHLDRQRLDPISARGLVARGSVAVHEDHVTRLESVETVVRRTPTIQHLERLPEDLSRETQVGLLGGRERLLVRREVGLVDEGGRVRPGDADDGQQAKGEQQRDSLHFSLSLERIG